MSTFASNRAFSLLVAVALMATITALIVRDDAMGRADNASNHVHPMVPVGMHPLTEAARRTVAPDPSGRAEAGGVAVAHLSGGVPIDSARVEAGAPSARLFRTGYDSWEPTMGVTKKGVFFNASSNGGGAIVRSTDGGKKWKLVFDKHSFTADPYMFVDQDTDRVFANDYVPPCHLVSFSDDDGKSWTTAPPVGCYDNADHQTLFAGPPPDGGLSTQDYPNVVYLCSIGAGISIGSAASWCSKSLDGGLTWVPTGAPAYTDDPRHTGDAGIPGRCNGANAHGFVGKDGTVYLPRGWCGQPWLAMSRDEGLTWDRVQVSDIGMNCCGRLTGDEGLNSQATVPSHEAGVVADDKGNIFYTWVAHDRLPYLAVSRNGGKSWSKPKMIGPPGLNEANIPGIAIGPNGGLVVRYMGTENSPWKDPAGSYDDTRWNAYLTVIGDPLAKNPVLYTSTVSNEPLWVGECGPDPVRCGWGDFLDVVIGNDGEVWSVDVDLCADKKNECEESETIIGHLVGGPKL